ncbi:galactoside 2-alpha-L-fucosyltransferase Sec1-like [Diorhabda sublineata]|uniref:galactoside 2-alpha-L-fucosyltransferase Sec1-like n=1 Tax=Diorhabda sublineata TaxID=1163346 RepID=UPI0024E04D81|nr:galactoside 2-alpha-L-fucosyltransferase Sec1-like [Diorhabda sublineata]
MLSNNRNLLFKGIILALCIISCVHLFIFPLFETNTDSNIIRTYLDFEQSLCLNNIRKKRSFNRAKCPQYGIITVMQGGRLGNQIWEYASVWAYARETGLEPYIPRCIKLKLETIFDKLSLPTFETISHCLVQTDLFYLPSAKAFPNNTLDAWHFTNQSIILPKYITSPELISTWVQDITQEFSIKKSLLDKSHRILQAAVKCVNISVKTFIGVHVRRTDYVSYIKRKYNAEPVDSKFFLKAMDMFEKKYPDSIFIIVSDDPKWCWKEFKFKKNAYVVGKYHGGSSTPALDLTILASCNHTIFDYGTYGMWGALLAGGETVYYDLNPEYSSHKLGRYMKNWHSL